MTNLAVTVFLYVKNPESHELEMNDQGLKKLENIVSSFLLLGKRKIRCTSQGRQIFRKEGISLCGTSNIP